MTTKRCVIFDFTEKERRLIDDFGMLLESVADNEATCQALHDMTFCKDIFESVAILWNLAFEDNIYYEDDDE